MFRRMKKIICFANGSLVLFDFLSSLCIEKNILFHKYAISLSKWLAIFTVSVADILVSLRFPIGHQLKLISS